MKYEDKLSEMRSRRAVLKKRFGYDNWRVEAVNRGIEDLETEMARFEERYYRLFDARSKRNAVQTPDHMACKLIIIY